MTKGAVVPARPQRGSRRGVARTATRRSAGLVVLLAVLAVAVLVSVAVGSKDIPLPTVLEAFRDYDVGLNEHFIVWEMRLPRTLTGVAVGSGLAVAGALIQALTRNPLADPGILGVNAGAAFFVALGVAVLGVASVSGYVWFAFFGALVVTVGVYLIGSAGRGPADPVRLTLAGVALGAVLSGITLGMTLLDPEAFDQMRNWNAGSIAGRGYDVLLPVLPFLVVGVVLAMGAASSLNAIALGDDLATSLGTRVVFTRTTVIIAVTLLAGGATAIAGPIMFVGLMVPHVARWITGPEQRWIIAYSLVMGPILVIVSDVLGRVVIRPGELPVGIVTAFVGAPVLIALIRRKKASGL
ncbi:FecCD family ABC transporter permease [Dietzia sp. PP-33]|uniref:FecCD family ABC transporter permease n=1 Tax=Dietzia sp. PP-33 TaxID=2957500 RepID=UPI0029A2ACDC|nr:iron chelate uptake ABC transporter family permease subunit [Dietzia sp. PP-33]MDX2358080.1 iron chelate uptake ABC transporter family permease subunit [Dietzia sp. PP-33]